MNDTETISADIRADDLTKDGSSIIGLQMGSNKFANQSGMSFGAVRHVSDIKVGDGNKRFYSLLR